jgi:hypothetical protein
LQVYSLEPHWREMSVGLIFCWYNYPCAIMKHHFYNREVVEISCVLDAGNQAFLLHPQKLYCF